MFSATVSASTFEDVLDAAGVLVDECRIHLRAGGLTVRAADPAVVAMVELALDEEAFDAYETDGETIGVDVTRLSEVASVADGDDRLHLELDVERRKLLVETRELSYSLALVDPDAIRQEPDLPEIDPPAEIVLEGAQFDRGIAAADMVSEHLRLRVDEEDDTFHVEADGDTDDVHLELTRDQLTALSPGPADSLYSLDYLKEMNRAIPADANVEMKLGEEFLLQLTYEIEDGGPEVAYRLAPRIQSA